MAQDIDILIYVEDPGAANFVADLPAALAEYGWRTSLMAEGFAYLFLLQRGIQPEPISHSVKAQELLSQLNPRLLMVGTSENVDTFGFELIAEARIRKTKNVGVVDAFGNADYRFRGRTENPLQHVPEWLIAPDRFTKQAYVSFGFPSEKITICGHPHYDFIRRKASQTTEQDREAYRKIFFPKAPPNIPVVVFLAEISTGLNPQKYQRSSDYTLKGTGLSSGRTEIVLEEFLEAVRFSNKECHLVLRLHPKNTTKELAGFLGQFHQVSQKESIFDLITTADLVVGMTSMALVEAALMGKPTLSIVPREVEKEFLLARLGLTPVVTTREQLRSTLAELLQSNLKIATTDLDNDFVPGALQRIILFIEKVMNGDEGH